MLALVRKTRETFLSYTLNRGRDSKITKKNQEANSEKLLARHK